MKKKKFYRKKKFYKKKKYVKMYKKPPTGFPNKMYCKLNYSTETSYTTGTLSHRTYCINSLYDPGQSLFGTQPMLFDQLAAIYRRYKVHACKVTY